MKPFNFIFRSTLILLSLSFLASCGDEIRCIKGEGDVQTRTMELGAFDGVKVNGSSKVYISYGAQQRVEVKAQPNVLDAISRKVSNGIWEIETDRCFRRHKTIEVYITLPELTHVEINGSGEITVQSTFDAEEFTSVLNGSGKIRATFEAELARTRISGSGNVELSGRTEQHNVSVTGSGKTKAFNLAAERVIVNINGSGDAEVAVSEVLEANISGSGKVYYSGNPASVTSQVTGSGKVEKR